MLPVTVQFIVAMLAYALNERMARRLEYLQEEVRVLKEALQTATAQRRIPLTDEQRRRLASKGKALTPAEREECCQIVRPSPIFGLVPEARCPQVRLKRRALNVVLEIRQRRKSTDGCRAAGRVAQHATELVHGH